MVVVLGGAGLFGLLFLFMHRGTTSAPAATPTAATYDPNAAGVGAVDPSSYPPTYSGGGDQGAISDLASAINTNDSQLMQAIAQIGTQTVPVTDPTSAGTPSEGTPASPTNVTVNVNAPVPKSGAHNHPGAHPKTRSPSVPPGKHHGAHTHTTSHKPAKPKPAPKPKHKSKKHH